jgi:hypothetical protein
VADHEGRTLAGVQRSARGGIEDFFLSSSSFFERVKGGAGDGAAEGLFVFIVILIFI